jgi:hypothetical protein
VGSFVDSGVGDYSGMPLKIIRAVLDGFTIAVIGSGLYLYLVRWSRTGRRRVHLAIETHGVAAE